MKNNLTTIPVLKINSFRQAKKAFIFIWISGVICIITGLLTYFNFFSQQNNKDSWQLAPADRQQSGISIDPLLLSSDEALLADKKSFVNNALRFQWRNQVPDLNLENNRVILYENILKKKLQQFPRASVADFSIKPIPK